MAEKLRCAVIGVGAIGLDHLNSLLHCRRAAAVAIAEVHAARARHACDCFKIPRSYSDYQELLEQPDIDAVTVALPNHLHAGAAIAALKARKHVLLEMPMTTTGRDAVRIAETADKMRRILMVGTPLRFHPQTQVARQIIHRNELGEAYHARAFCLKRSGIPRIGSWYTQKKLAGGGCATDLGAPLLDACLHLLGEFQAVSVAAHSHARFGPLGVGEGNWGPGEIDHKKPFDVEDYMSGLIKLKSGRTLQWETSWAGFHQPDGRESGIDILGTAGGLSLFPARLCRNTLHGYETIHLHLGKLPQPEDCVHHFVNCVLDGRKPLVTLDEAVRVRQILDALYQSAASGREVLLNGR